MAVHRLLPRYHPPLLFAIHPATLSASLLQRGVSFRMWFTFPCWESPRNASVAISDKRFICDFDRREFDSDCQTDDVEMLEASCGIYNDIDRSRVYYLVRSRTAWTDYTVIDTHDDWTAKRRTGNNVSHILAEREREITWSKTEVNFLVKAYFRPRRLYLLRNNFAIYLDW